MRVLRDALVTWRCFAVEAVQDQRILTQTLALESYEQALSEVGDERAALEERAAALRASVVELEDKLLRQTEEFVAEFARLQAEEHARVGRSTQLLLLKLQIAVWRLVDLWAWSEHVVLVGVVRRWLS